MLLNPRAQRDLTFIAGFPCSVHELRSNWLSCLVFPGLSDAVEASTSGFLSLHRETKFIIGFDFPLTLSSPAFFCVLFDIALTLLMELKWLMSNKHKRWFHSSRVKFPSVSMSASWFFGVMKQSQSALFCSITDIAILFEFTCVMNVRDQTR